MKIYFDMDGVLADFDKAVIGVDDGGMNLNLQTKQMDVAMLNAKQRRWRLIENMDGFWRDMPVMEGVADVLRTAAEYGELYVLTKTPGAGNFAAGKDYVDFVAHEKRAWIKRNMSDWFDDAHVVICAGAKEKLILPGADDVLIDDRSGNVADWCAAGGRGIVYSSPEEVIKQLTLLCS